MVLLWGVVNDNYWIIKSTFFFARHLVNKKILIGPWPIREEVFLGQLSTKKLILPGPWSRKILTMHFAKLVPVFGPQKWHFRWPNENSKTTSVVQTFPKYGL